MTSTAALSARLYPQADRLFRGTRWRGADDAYTVDLGDGRALWLFGDTFVADEGVDSRVGSHFIHNSIGLQTGADPTTARIELRWDDSGEVPGDYFTGDDTEHYLWPYHGARLGNRVLVFAMEVGPSAGVPSDDGVWDEIPFTIEGWRAFWIDGVDGPVDNWSMTRADRLPAESRGIVGAAVLVDGDHLYAWSHDAGAAYLCRWEIAVAAAGDLSSARWWDGSAWSSSVADAVVAVSPAATEFTVHKHGERYCLLDIWPFGVPETALNLRWADRPEGPWTPRAAAMVLPDAARDGVLVYAGKAHPELDGPGLLVTFASNTNGLGEQIWNDETIYYPRFVVVELG